MANTNSPVGLRPVRLLNGRPYQAGGLECVADDSSNALGIGTPVTLSGTGSDSGLPGVARITVDDTDTGNNTPIFGVIVGILGKADGALDRTGVQYVPAGEAYRILVETDPMVLYEIQEDAGGSALAKTSIGSFVNIGIGAVDTTNGLDGSQIDRSTVAAADSGSVELDEMNLRLIGLQQDAETEFGDYAKWLVQIVNHQLSASGARAATVA